MNVWKVILATLVIYSAGLLTGGLLVRQFTPPPPRPPAESGAAVPLWMQQRFLERMKRELELTPAQSARLQRVFAESRERVDLLWSLVAPEMRTEFREVEDRIKAELTPEQRRQFDELRRARTRRAEDPRPAEERFRDRRFAPPRGPGSTSGQPRGETITRPPTSPPVQAAPAPPAEPR